VSAGTGAGRAAQVILDGAGGVLDVGEEVAAQRGH
jgi:hypothetical protein